MPAFILWSMKKSTLPSKNAAKPTQQPSSQPVQRCVSCDSTQDQLPHTPAQLASPSYQDMADQSPQVQEAAALQLAADAMAAPMAEEPPVQGWFTWKGTRIDSKHFDGFKATNPDLFKNKEISRALTQSEKSPKRIAAEKAMEKEWESLKACADDPNDQGTVQMGQGKAELIQILRNYQKKKATEAQMTAVADSIARSAIVDQGETEDDTEFSPMERELISLNAFPVANIKELAEKAADEGGGFITEILLALDLARNHPQARIQVGVVPIGSLKGFLGYEPAASKDKVLGHPGGDVAVWYDPSKYPNEKTMFIQAKKTFVPKNIGDLMEGAGNQLTGNNASGATSANHDAVKEGTFTGEGYQGVAFGRVEGTIDPSALTSAAEKAFQAGPKHVHRVVFEVVDHGGTLYYEYERKASEDPDRPSAVIIAQKPTKANPLLNTKAIAPAKKQESAASTASAQVSLVAPPQTLVRDDADDALLEAGIKQSLGIDAPVHPVDQPKGEFKLMGGKVVPPKQRVEETDAIDSEDEAAATPLKKAAAVVPVAAAVASATAEDASAKPAKKAAPKAAKSKPVKRLTKSQKKKAAQKKAAQQAQAQNADGDADGDEEAS